jgi:hypothetical protein
MKRRVRFDSAAELDKRFDDGEDITGEPRRLGVTR